MHEILLPALILILAFFVQTNSGFGAGLVSIPLLLGFMSLKDASAFMSIYFLLFSVIMLAKNWSEMDKKILIEMVIFGSIGLTLGIFALGKFGDLLLVQRLMGAFVILYVIYTQFAKTKLTIFNHLGPLFGFVGGFSSGFFSAGGHFFVIYAESKIRKVEVLRATIIGSLGFSNFLRVPLLVSNDILSWEIAKHSLLLLPAFALGIVLGQVFYDRVNKRLIKELIMGLLFVAGIKLLVG